MALLMEMKNVNKTFFSQNGEVKVLNNISFAIYDNEIIAILGPSGCGKSTILNLLSKLEEPTSGEIISKCKKGYMFQKDNLMEWRNIYNNILIGLEIKHLKSKQNLEYVDSLLKKYQLEEFKNYHPHELSGGMRQRVSLIRTLALKPDLLLLDKQLAFAEFLHIKPVIVLNKIDLDDKHEFLNIQKIYEEIGYKVIQTDAKNGIGVEEI